MSAAKQDQGTGSSIPVCKGFDGWYPRAPGEDNLLEHPDLFRAPGGNRPKENRRVPRLQPYPKKQNMNMHLVLFHAHARDTPVSWGANLLWALFRPYSAGFRRVLSRNPKNMAKTTSKFSARCTQNVTFGSLMVRTEERVAFYELSPYARGSGGIVVTVLPFKSCNENHHREVPDQVEKRKTGRCKFGGRLSRFSVHP